MQTMLQDLRYALRQLRRSPAFAVTAILTLALGIGANTAIFSLLDQALLRSLPVRDPQQLVVLEGTGKAWSGHASDNGGDQEAYFSYPMYRDLRDALTDQGHKAFSDLIASAPADITFARNGVAQSGRAELVSGNYFSALGVQPALGRAFTQSEDVQKDANPVAVLSFDFWREHLGADPSIIGASVTINAHPFTVVGVAAPRFHSAIWGETPSVFVPMAMIGQILPGKDKRLTDHTDKWMNILGRLQPGESLAQAEAESAPLWHALRADELKAIGHKSQRFTDDYLTKSRLLVLPGARGFSYQRDDFKKPLLAIMAMALLVLLIAGVNVASLLLVRSAVRVREFSLRYALGAGIARIVQQLLLEGLLIGIAGGITGMLLAPVAIRGLVQQLAGDQGSVAFSPSGSYIDARLLAFNFAIALVVSVFFSLAPVLRLRKPDLTSALRQQAGSSSGAMLGFRRAIVCLQIGLSVLLLVGAGLFVRTMQKLRSVDAGFNTAHLVTFGINPTLAGYAPSTVQALQQRLLDNLSVLPGTQSVAATNDPELSGTQIGGSVTVAGYTAPPEEDYDVEEPYVSPNYFTTMQVPLLAGRLFSDSDTADHPHVAIVNETFVKHFCGSIQNCLGKAAATHNASHGPLDILIVGVVRDAKHSGVRDPALPTLFQPLKQNPDPAQTFFYLRTFSDPALALPTVRRALQQLDPALVPVALRTMDTQIDDNLTNDRLVALLAVAFGALATLLAGIGIYGVLAYTTAQRTREIGIRMALGSSRTAISLIILSDVLILAAVGIGIALPAGFGLSHLVRSQLYSVSPADPLTLAAAGLLVLFVTLLAALIPARRGASVDPMQALRAE